MERMAGATPTMRGGAAKEPNAHVRPICLDDEGETRVKDSAWECGLVGVGVEGTSTCASSGTSRGVLRRRKGRRRSINRMRPPRA